MKSVAPSSVAFKAALSFFTLSVTAGALLMTALPAHAQKTTTLQEEIESARKAGYPVTPQEMQAPLPPPDQNAAPLYLQWRDLRTKRKLIQYEDENVMVAASSLNATQEQITAARKLLVEKKEAFDLIHAAAERPQCVFTTDYSLASIMMPSRWVAIRTMNRFLMAESALTLRDGKPAEAVRIAALGFQLAHHCAQSPGTWAALLSYDIDRSTIAQLRNILYVSGDRPEIRTAVKEALTKHAPPVRPAVALRGLIVEALGDADMLRWQQSDWDSERVRYAFDLTSPGKTEVPDDALELLNASIGTVNSITAEDLSDEIRPMVLPIITDQPSHKDATRYEQWVNSNARLAVISLHTILDAAGKPFDKRIGLAGGVVAGLSAAITKEAIQTQGKIGPSSTPIAALCSENAFDFLRHRSDDYDQARGDILNTTCLLLDYKAHTGAFPEKLSDLGVSIPTDPFDNKPLKYRREEEGFVLYAVGRNHQFDGGKPYTMPPGAEAGIRYPAPSGEAPWWKIQPPAGLTPH